jgi:glycosyltransferase involved in cell wall biosynthesis
MASPGGSSTSDGPGSAGRECEMRSAFSDPSGGSPSVTLLMCTLDEEESLPYVLPRIPNWINEVLIVDGGSRDRTICVAKALCPRARILRQPRRGKGAALRYGISQSTSKIIVTIDADGETDPAEIERFVRPLTSGFDFVKGSRLARGKPAVMPFYRWLGNRILVTTFNGLFGTRFTDICSGYNAFWRDSFLRIQLTHDSFEMEQQLLARVCKRGMRILELAHVSRGRIGGRSKTRSLQQGLVDWLVIIKERVR